MVEESSRKPILELGGTKRLDVPDERHQVIVALQKWGIESPASDLEWLQHTLGDLWRWEAVGAIGQLIERPGRRHGMTIQFLLSLVPSLRALSICEGFPELLRGLVNYESFEATQFEIAVALQAMSRAGPFSLRLSPSVVIGHSLKKPDLAVSMDGQTLWVECKTVNAFSASVKSRLSRLDKQFDEAIRQLGLQGPPEGVWLQLDVGDGKGFERALPRLVDSFAGAVDQLGWPALIGHDIDAAGRLWPAAAPGSTRPRMIGIRPPWRTTRPPSGNRINRSSSIDWRAWQSRKVLDLLREALKQLPPAEPRFICIETPNPEIHLKRAQNWISTSPLGENAAVLLIDRSAGTAHWVSRLANPRLVDVLV